MLTLKFPEAEHQPAFKLRLEHSLQSISKWESIYKKTFFSLDEKTQEESRTYIECMVLDEDPPEGFLNRLSSEHMAAIQEYMNDSHTATTFREDASKGGARQVITTDLMYSWLIQFQIPFTCDTWNFGRLMTLIRICGIQQTKPKKMNKQEMLAERNRLNAERRQQLASSG